MRQTARIGFLDVPPARPDPADAIREHYADACRLLQALRTGAIYLPYETIVERLGCFDTDEAAGELRDRLARAIDFLGHAVADLGVACETIQRSASVEATDVPTAGEGGAA